MATHQIEAVLHDAGMLVGWADARSIGYGRFEIISFETMAYEESKYKKELKEKTS